MRIGIAGFGKMGSAIASRLRDSGREVIAWDRRVERPGEAGFPTAATPRKLAEHCDVVISSLFDATAVTAVYTGADGLVLGGHGKMFLEMSTVQPSTQEEIAGAVRQNGGAFVECPVSGTTGPARSGQLVGFVGGDAADVERARPVLNLLCRRIEHVGPVGSGALTKLAVNLPLIVFWQAFGEAMGLMRPLRKDPSWLVDVFSDTAGAPAVMKVRAEAIRATLRNDDDVKPTFDIEAMRKDLVLMVNEARAIGQPLPVAQRALDALNEVTAAGWGQRDCAWLSAYWASRTEFKTVTEKA